MNIHSASPDIARPLAATQAGAVRFEALDSWRGIAAIMVVLFHAPIESHVHEFHLVRAGEMFVDFFFVLSGFVIAHAQVARLTTGRDLAKFLFLRIGRLYPLHLAVLALFVVFELAKAQMPGMHNPADPAFSGTNEPAYLISNLLLVQALWPTDTLSWNTPSWSISAEYVAYTLFGLALLMPRRALPLLLAATALMMPAVLYVFSDRGMQSTVQFGVVRALYGFAVGALVHVLLSRRILMTRRARGEGNPTLGWSALELAAAGAAIAIVWVGYDGDAALAAPLVFGLAVCVFAVEGGALSRVLRTPLPLLLGTLSYSIYMVHLLVQLRMMNVARLAGSLTGHDFLRETGATARYGLSIDSGNAYVGDLLIVIMLMLTLGVSLFTYRLVEMPGQALFRSWATRLFPDRR